jgi:hypothetical protein
MVRIYQMRAVKAFQTALDPTIDMHSLRSRTGSVASRKDLMRQRLAKQQAVHESTLYTATNGLTPVGDVSPKSALQLEHRIEINRDS